MKQLIQTLLLASVMMILTGCPGGGSSDSPSASGIGGGSTTSDTSDGSGTDSDSDGSSGSDGSSSTSDEPPALLGSFNSLGAFVSGLIGSSNKSVLSADQSTDLTVVLADSDGTQVTEQATYTFTSTCLSTGDSEVDENFVSNSNGTVTVTYFARGCDGTDTVTAEAVTDTSTFTASVSLETDGGSVSSGSGSSATASFLGTFNSFGAFVDGLVKSSNTEVLFTNDSTTLTAALADQNGDAIA